MNRRQKIIVSVTGIFIVLLVLLGLTYGYFLTRITGNSNPTSISVTTANLELVYGDGTTSILTSSNPIEPGKFTSSKDFTVTNNGNALTDYAVTLEDFSIVYANDTVIDGASVKAGTVTKMEYPSDMQMTITCVIESDDEDRNGQACGNIDSTLPTENSILLTNSIEVDDVHKYVLTLTYLETGTDQSLDMNKTIKGKIDIIDPKSTIDLEGTVATYQTGDYVEINSTPIKSEIVDGKYKIIGVEPGSHTLYVKYKDASGNVQTRGSETLTIKKGDEANVSGSIITFTDISREATVNVASDYSVTIDEEIKGYNPYKEGTLAYNIINNSMLNKNGTQFFATPLTVPAKETSGMIYSSYMDPTSYISSSYYTSKWYIYGSEITINKDNGNFKINNPKVGRFSDVALNMRGGYTNNQYGYSTEEEARSHIDDEFSYIHKIGDSTTTSMLYYNSVTKISESTENILSVTKDSYGTSYYYRGGVTDNYINFAGMCWRIVRIEGDGSVKLILEDKNTTCESLSYTGNWSLGEAAFGSEFVEYEFEDNNEDLIYVEYFSMKFLEGNLNNLFEKFQNDKLSGVLTKLKSGNWCYDDRAYQDLNGLKPIINTENFYIYKNKMYYNSYINLVTKQEATLKCDGTIIDKYKTNVDMYVSALTADEVAYAGGKYRTYNNTIYLINDFMKEQDENEDIYSLSGASFWTISPADYGGYADDIFVVSYKSSLTANDVDHFEGDPFARPVISLKNNIYIISGDGTKSNPYVVE